MATTPTFDGTTLASAGAVQRNGSPMPRSYTGTLPGVAGHYVQEAPVGGRMILLTGVLTATGTTRAAAISALRVAVEAIQAKIGLVRSYVGTGNRTYSNTLLMSYDTSPIAVYGLADPFTAIARITCQMLHTVATGVA